MKNLEIKNVDCHATLAMIEKRWRFPRRTLRALLGMTKSGQSGRSLLPICEADAPLFLSDVYNKRYTSEKITSRCPQSGRSMIEMLGVLAIIGVLSVGGIAGYSKAMQKYRINKTIEQITLIATNVRSFYSTQQNYSGLDSDTDDGKKIIQKAKLVPDEMLDIENGAITDIKDAFNQSLSIYNVGRFESGDNRAFVIDFGGSDLSKDACIELATHNWQTIENVITVAVGVEALPASQYVAFEGCSGIDSTEPLLGCQNGDTISLPLPMDKVVNACSTASHITIKFR